MSYFTKSLATAALAITSSTAAYAAPTVYFGENQNPVPPFTVVGTPVTARANFLSQLTAGVSQESFESFALNSSPTSLSFNGSLGTITATLSGSGTVIDNALGNPFGRFATQGSNLYDTNSAFGATFSTAVAAFGFYGTDIGDFSGQLTLTLTHATGPNTVLMVPHGLPALNGSLLFYGVIDTANPFTGVQFSTTNGIDFFGFDQLVVGDVRQVTGGVPESSTWSMLIAGFGIVGFAMRAHTRKVAFASLA
jgi:hypothetical protein